MVSLFDGTVRPPKFKRMICVVAAEGWFLRINSRQHFRPTMLIRAADNNAVLDHDSYIELRGVIDHDLTALSADLARGDARLLGRLSYISGRELIAHIKDAVTFARSEAQQMAASLEQAYPPG